MKRFLSILLLFCAFAANAQHTGATYINSTGQVSSKPIAINGSIPANNKEKYYDNINFNYRPYRSAAEVLSYLPPQQRYQGLKVWVDSCGAFNSTSGVLTPGCPTEYVFDGGVLLSTYQTAKGAYQELVATSNGQTTFTPSAFSITGASKSQLYILLDKTLVTADDYSISSVNIVLTNTAMISQVISGIKLRITFNGNYAAAGTTPVAPTIYDKPYFQSKSATPITSAFNPVNSTWSEMGQYDQFGFDDNEFSITECKWSAADIRNFSGVQNANGAVIANGQLSVPASTPGVENDYAIPVSVKIPYVAYSIDVVSMPTGSQSLVSYKLSSGNGIGVQVTEVGVVYNNVNNSWTIRQYNNSTDQTLNTITYVPTFPFTLGVTMTHNTVAAWIKEANKEWKVVVLANKATNSNMQDWQNPTLLYSLKNLTLTTVVQGTSAPLVLGKMKSSYAKGVGLANFALATNTKGVPIQEGSDFFAVCNTAHVCASMDNATGIETSSFTIIRFNPFTGSIKREALIVTDRGGLLHGENSGSMTFDEITNKWQLIIPSWGSINNGTSGGGEIQMYRYETQEMPRGVVVLTGGVKMTMPNANSNYDPSNIIKRNGLYTLSYVTTNALVAWSQYYPVIATSPDLITWTNTAQDATGGGDGRVEGAKFYTFGGVEYALASHYDEMLVYNMNLVKLGVFPVPASLVGKANISSSHPSIFPVNDGVKTRYFWLFFDNRTWNGRNYSWGVTHILEANSTQTGNDNPTIKFIK